MELNDLKQIVLLHRVCWEIWPVYYIDKDEEKVQIGFELDLAGVSSDSEQVDEPGSADSKRVLNDLKKIADWITPKETQECRSDIQAFDNLIQYSPLRRYRDDVTVGIKILHRVGVDRPVDKCEIECLKEIEEKLKTLGAQRGHWKKLGN